MSTDTEEPAIGQYPPSCPENINNIPFPSTVGIYFCTFLFAAALAIVCVRSYFKSIRVLGVKLRNTHFSVAAWVLYFTGISLEYVKTRK